MHADAFPMRQIPILLPDVVSSDETIVFGQWLVDDGAEVLYGERIAEVLTAGVLVYVVAPAEGTLIHGNLRRGSPLTLAATLGIVATNAAKSSGE